VEDEMNQQTYEDFIQGCYDKRVILCLKKGHDYATDDILNNFKRVAKLCSILHIDVTCPEGVAMFFIVHKLDRENNLKLKKDVKCESRADTMEMDLPNYVDLYNALRKERL
jgi:hypothetical protein